MLPQMFLDVVIFFLILAPLLMFSVALVVMIWLEITRPLRPSDPEPEENPADLANHRDTR